MTELEGKIKAAERKVEEWVAKSEGKDDNSAEAQTYRRYKAELERLKDELKALQAKQPRT
jgi:hypothetical protein